MGAQIKFGSSKGPSIRKKQKNYLGKLSLGKRVCVAKQLTWGPG
jgi:hypothetical protein